MAVVTRVEIVDDLDSSEGASTVPFAFDGVEYEIDLGELNRKQFEEAIAPYIEAGRRVRGRRRARKLASVPTEASQKPKPHVIRQWAQENGYDLPSRGRIPEQVRDAFAAAQA